MNLVFEEEIKKKKNLNILSYLNNINDMSQDEKDQLKLITLWESINSFDDKRGCIFSTHLYNCCRFKFLKHINRKREDYPCDSSNFQNIPIQVESDILEELPILYRLIIEDRYVYRLNIIEMLQKYRLKRWQLKKLIEDSRSCLEKIIKVT